MLAQESAAIPLHTRPRSRPTIGWRVSKTALRTLSERVNICAVRQLRRWASRRSALVRDRIRNSGLLQEALRRRAHL